MLPEAGEYLNWIQDRRNKIFEIVDHAPAEAWNWTPTNDSTNSLFVLAKHCIGSEHGWIFEILGRGKKTRNRDSEFVTKGSTLEDLRAEYQRVGQETRDVLSELTIDDLATTRFREGHGEVSVRWILLHVIAHLSEHLGQMELTKQLWEQKDNYA